jgi:formylmethanofuran dehydrogenase subunit C
VVTGEGTYSDFGAAFAAGDFNSDGKTDLVVGASRYSSDTGRVYIFYNDGSIPTTAATADVIITGEVTGSYFGNVMISGDFNADGKIDLAVGSQNYSSSTGRVYLFYNDGSIPTTAATADVIISNVSAYGRFGITLAAGDLNSDGRIDLAVGAGDFSSSPGGAFVFYNDGSYPASTSGADVSIAGETGTNFAYYGLATGDFNADGRTDLAGVARGYSSGTGRAYLFYNDGSIPTTAATADVIITGEAAGDYFGSTLISGDFNADGRTDLAVGSVGYSASAAAGRVYLFYNDGSIPTTAATADVKITGTTSDDNFGSVFAVGDFNVDGRTDLVVGSYHEKVYVFYNDGSIPTTAATADVVIMGEGGNIGYYALIADDFNSDGRADLVSSAMYYLSETGRIYIFCSQNGQVNTNVNLTGETTSNYFGYAMTSGDFNADGKTDLAVGANLYSTNTGRAYIFYNDGSIPTTAATADVIITGETTSNYFGASLVFGDFNSDGRTDLAVGAWGYSTSTGRTYIFYNDGSIPTTAATADVIITGETTFQYFAMAMGSGDFNADGKIDLVVGAYGYSANAGRTYIFYNDGSIPTTAATADVFINGESSSYSGSSFISGDFNADGRTDLVMGAFFYSSGLGRTYIFYNDGGIPTTAATADVIITGSGGSGGDFGYAFAAGDFNNDGRVDLAIGANDSDISSTGSTYIFYNDGSIPTTAATADLIIIGEANSRFGGSLVSGDFNADGKTDLTVGASGYSTNTGRAYIFYNDGSIPTTAATADVIITGETTSNYFGASLISGDFNFDGKTDLAVGASRYSTNTGRVYLYETRDNFAWQLQPQSSLSGGLRTNPSFSGQELKMTGEVGTGKFGNVLASGDFNADGKTDFVVGAYEYASSTGRVYIFYNDGHLASAATNADVIITGEASNNFFGIALSAGDFNADGRTDLVVGAQGYSAPSGRVYIFYNDGSIPTTAASADFTITGGGSEVYVGSSLIVGDFNADGRTDIAVGGIGYASFTGRVYVFYNDGSIPTTAVSADVIITGEAVADNFGAFFVTGDFNTDGKTDLVASAEGYSSAAGRVYIFYNDGSIPTAAASADVKITGGTANDRLGLSLAAGDFNTDGRVDIVAGAGAGVGGIYLFYNDGSLPITMGTADASILGDGSASYFGSNLASGDFNADGKTDIVAGAYGSMSGALTGSAYIFNNDGSYPASVTGADISILGETANNYFGRSFVSGDFNADGKTDLVVGAYGYASNRGRVYMYTFNDGVITGEATSYFGASLVSGDFNADGKTDLAVGAYWYSTQAGRTYIFYNDGSIPTTAATADVIITGEASSYFGISLTSGDFNADGKTDLTVGASGYSTSTGRTYIFYNDGSIPTTAVTADVIITGEAGSYLGYSLNSGDFNADGKTDLAVGAYTYSSNTGRTYIFYNDGSIPTTAATADVIITGETTNNYFGSAIISGDFNADGKIDFAVGSLGYSSNTGRTYIFYNDGSIPTTAATADVIITGEANSFFGYTLIPGDFNADGKIDFAVGCYVYSANTGRTYIFYNDGSIPTTAATADVIITGEASSYFGYSLTSGDFNADGKTDLAVGAYTYSSNTGRTYIFYNDGSYPNTADMADIIITGETTNNYFGYSLIAGDFNADGKTDLAVGAYRYSTYTGRVHVFITEAKVEESIQQLKSKGTFKAKGSYQVK